MTTALTLADPAACIAGAGVTRIRPEGGALLVSGMRELDSCAPAEFHDHFCGQWGDAKLVPLDCVEPCARADGEPRG